MLTAIIQAILAYLRSGASRKPVGGVEPSAATTLPAPSPDAAHDSPTRSVADLTAQFEGFSARPYQDPGNGTWTIGYGSTHDSWGKPVTAETPPVTTAEGRLLLARDLESASHELTADVKVILTENQQEALEDFIYNVGSGNFRSSTLLHKLNAGDYAGAAAEFDKWDHAGGKVLAGLLKRREAERKLFEAA